MDVLTEALRSIQIRSQIHGRLELTAPWGMRVESLKAIAFYALSRGSCLLDVSGRRLALAAGDVVLLRAGISHTVRDRIGSRVLSPVEVYAQRGGRCGGIVHYGGGGAPTTIVSGGLYFSDARLSPVIATLPDVIHVRGDGGVGARWLESTLQLVAAEMDAEQPGYELVASRLADVMFVQVLRAHVASFTCTSRGWLRALWDPELGVALQQIHERAVEPWTVEALARTAGMSRSAFAARFKEVLGVAPLAYLTRWRMQQAAAMLTDGHAPTAAVANAVGYDTHSAFAKAFRRATGETPGAYRRRARDAAARAGRPA